MLLILQPSDTNCKRLLVSLRVLFPPRPTDQSPRIQGGSIGERIRGDVLDSDQAWRDLMPALSCMLTGS